MDIMGYFARIYRKIFPGVIRRLEQDVELEILLINKRIQEAHQIACSWDQNALEHYMVFTRQHISGVKKFIAKLSRNGLCQSA